MVKGHEYFMRHMHVKIAGTEAVRNTMNIASLEMK